MRAAIGGSYNWVAMNVIIPAAVLTLDLDEQLVYEAILREGRLPGGAVLLADERAESRETHRRYDKDVRSQLC